MYVDYILNTGIKDVFNEFYKGFYRVCNSNVLKIFNVHEFMSMAQGSQNFDWSEWQRVSTILNYKYYYNMQFATNLLVYNIQV